MEYSILLATPNVNWGNETKEQLKAIGYSSEVVFTGKECQVRASKTKFFAVILDFEIISHSAFEVLKFLKLSCPSLKILLLMKSKEMNTSYMNSSSLQKAGIAEVIYGYPSAEKIKKFLISLQGYDSWKNLKFSDASSDDAPIRANDKDFMEINIEDFYSGNVTVFDHYIKLGPNNYKKILNKGEIFDPLRLRKYQSSGVKHLYLLLSERMNYINFINELVKTTLSRPNAVASKKIILPIRSITIKYMEEVYTSGLKPQLIEQGKDICQSMFEYIKKDKSISKTLEGLQNDPSVLNHSFLVSFFSIFICKHIDWAGPRTVDSIAMGALLHDIGILALPPALREKSRAELNSEQDIIYKQHPKLGVDLLKKSSMLSEQVLQVVYQHHEHIDGSGYPNQISGSKIYPLAKIVSLADAFTELLIEMKLPPKEVLKQFLKSRELLQRFDPLLIKALADGIVGDDER